MNQLTANQLNVQMPNWLQITKVSDEYYRVIDTSVDSIGFHLGSFQTKQAAQRFAIKVSQARAEVRNRNALKLRRAVDSSQHTAAHP